MKRKRVLLAVAATALLPVAIAAASLLSGCARIHYAPAPPPPARHEAVPPAPGDGWAWIPGHRR